MMDRHFRVFSSSTYVRTYVRLLELLIDDTTHGRHDECAKASNAAAAEVHVDLVTVPVTFGSFAIDDLLLVLF